ncbi:phosphatase, partial [Enterococcus faecium]
VANRDAAFDEWLAEGRPGYVERYATPLEDAIDLIHDAKGAAIIAHPWARHTEQILTAPVLEQLKNEHGLEGIEVDHEDHDDDTRSLL